MSAVYTATSHLLPGDGKRELTPDEHADISWVLDAAAAWQAGQLPLRELASYGDIAYQGKPSAAYTRFVAIRSTAASDPRRTALLAAIDALVVYFGNVLTTRGCFTPQELGEAGVTVSTRRAS